MAYKWCFLLVALISLFCVEVCVGEYLHYRREVQTNKREKNETNESTPSSSTDREDSTPSVRPKVKSNDRECLQFEHSFCNSQFGYTNGLFPNNKGQTAVEAAAEFEHFSQLLNSGCSDKLGIFLCFTYFPLCIPNMNSIQEILPCKETCEEVHKSECTEYVVNATKGEGWADHLDCDQDIFKPLDSEQCASGVINGGRVSPDNGGSENEICEDGDCASKCAIRNSCSGSTFKNTKNTYKFAAKVSVLSKLENGHNCQHAYSVQLEEQFNLLSRHPTTNQLVEAPPLQNISIIHTSPSNCPECPLLTIGSTYLIAGQYDTSEDGTTTVWELPNSKSESLASKWEGRSGDRYNNKLQEWIDSANVARRQRAG